MELISKQTYVYSGSILALLIHMNGLAGPPTDTLVSVSHAQVIILAPNLHKFTVMLNLKSVPRN